MFVSHIRTLFIYEEVEHTVLTTLRYNWHIQSKLLIISHKLLQFYPISELEERTHTPHHSEHKQLSKVILRYSTALSLIFYWDKTL